jgi:hypothetical protein
MIAKCTWTKVSIDIDGSNSHLCANACKWHEKHKTHCDLFNQDLHKETWQQKFTRCVDCKFGTTTNPNMLKNG